MRDDGEADPDDSGHEPNLWKHAMADALVRQSHDLRGALSSIISGVRLLEDDRIKADPKTILRHVRNASDDLARLVNEVLAVGMAEAPDGRSRGPSEPKRGARPLAEGPLPDLAGLVLLVAEDHRPQGEILCNLLGTMGAEALLAGTGADALAQMDARAFDAALIDLEMPGMSGIEVMRSIRARASEAGAIPLLALTAHPPGASDASIYAAGADCIISKTAAHPAALGWAILRQIGRRSGGRHRETGATGEACVNRTPDVTRTEEEIWFADPDLPRDLLLQLVEDLRGVRGQLRDAVEAASMHAIREQTHVIVGLAGLVGADRLRRAAEILDGAAKSERIADLEPLHSSCRSELDALLRVVGMRAETPG